MENLFRKSEQTKEWKEQNNCTYFVPGGVVKDPNGYKMGFTLRIIQAVTTSVSGVKGGWVCELRHVNHGSNETFPCFLSSGGFASVSKFQADITETAHMPSIVVQNLDTKLLGSYNAWKNQQYFKRCKNANQLPDKSPVEHRNLQADGKTFCFAPDVMYEKTDAGVVRVTAAASRYYWVPSMLKNMLPLELYSGADRTDILEVIRSKLEADDMGDVFINFLLICGHTCILSFHYKEMLAALEHVPGLIVTGPWNTGKSFSTEVAASFLGMNAIKICVAKDTTLPALRARYTDDHMPLIVHDCQDAAVAAIALQECFEGRDVKKHETLLTPGASVAFTCNDKQMDYLQTRFEALSRALVIPMLKEMAPQTDEEFDLVRLGKLSASVHFESLLSVTAKELEALQRRAFGLRPKVTSRLTNVTDSHNRISENYAILIAATEVFLEKTGHGLWSRKVEPFVLNRLLPDAAPYFANAAGNASGCTKSETIGTVNEAGFDVLTQLCKALSHLRAVHPEEVGKYFVIQKDKPFIAVREDEFLTAAAKFQLSTKFFEILKKMPFTKLGMTVKFSDHAKRAVTVPKPCLSQDHWTFLDAPQHLYENDREDGSPGTVLHPVTKTQQTLNEMNTVSPFKKHPSTNQHRDDRSPGSPLASSTQNPEAVRGIRNSSAVNVSPVRPAWSDSYEDSDREATNPGAPHAHLPAPPRLNGSFTISSQVAIPAVRLEVGDGAVRGTGKSTRTDCSSCDQKKDRAGSDRTYLCTSCKLRYHMTCQEGNEKFCPGRPNAKKRSCTDCVQKQEASESLL